MSMDIDELLARLDRTRRELDMLAAAAIRELLARAASPANLEPVKRLACPSHCCPIHGCKYGYDDCPVATLRVLPEHPNNNGCESCEHDSTALPPGSVVVPEEQAVTVDKEGVRFGKWYWVSHESITGCEAALIPTKHKQYYEWFCVMLSAAAGEQSAEGKEGV